LRLPLVIDHRAEQFRLAVEDERSLEEVNPRCGTGAEDGATFLQDAVAAVVILLPGKVPAVAVGADFLKSLCEAG